MTGRAFDANFSQAMRYVTQGCHVRRASWADGVLIKQQGEAIVHAADGAEWTPTQADMLAHDWLVVDEQKPAEVEA